MESGRPSRRDALRIGAGAGGLLAASALSGCGFFATEPDDGRRNSGGDGDGDESGGRPQRQAPDLAELVASGDLPPLEERLPKDPVVIEPAERVGQYGGTWRAILQHTEDTAWLNRTVGYEEAMRYDPTGEHVLPNVVERMEMSDDAREFVLTLREGLRWSDGVPFTVDDVMFAWEDVVLSEELNPVTPAYLTSNGAPATLERLDDLTVVLTFPEPNALFPIRSTWQGHLVAHPSHYLEQFHIAHNPQVEQEAEAAGFDDWVAYFGDRNDKWNNPERPTLYAWVLVDPLGEGDRLEFVRNPYYWKVDPEGNQLPYIDRVVFDMIAEEQVIMLKVTNGELDMTSRHINSPQNKPVLGRSREDGGYDFLRTENTNMNEMVVALNLDHNDPAQREIYQNKDFRVALSLGIDREDLIDAVWQRQGVPWQAAPDDRSKYYDEEFALQYTEHDVDEANRLLDSIGLSEVDDDGWRLRPDGERLTVRMAMASPVQWGEGSQLVTQHWSDIGIHGVVDAQERALFSERKDWQANTHDAAVWTGDGGLKVEIVEPRWYFPFSGESIYATTWARWFATRGEEGTEPPPATREQMELYWELLRTPDEDDRDDLFRAILEIAREQFYAIGTVRIPDSYGIVRDAMRNVPDGMPESAVLNTPAPGNPPLWYFDE